MSCQDVAVSEESGWPGCRSGCSASPPSSPPRLRLPSVTTRPTSGGRSRSPASPRCGCSRRRGRARANYTGRTALAFVLVWLNPFYAMFGFVGFLDAYESLKGRWVYVGMLVVGITQAGSQSGGFPPQDRRRRGCSSPSSCSTPAWPQLHEMSLRTELRNDGARAAQRRARGGAAWRTTSLHDRLVTQAREAGVQEERARLAREIHDTPRAEPRRHRHPARGVRRRRAAGARARPRPAGARRGAALDARPLPRRPGRRHAARGPDRGRSRPGRPSTAVRADVVVVGDPVPLHPEVEATVLRIAQESLANVAKHADAGRVGVTLSYDGDEVVLDVRDDGVGFDVDRPDRAELLRPARHAPARRPARRRPDPRVRPGTRHRRVRPAARPGTEAA